MSDNTNNADQDVVIPEGEVISTGADGKRKGGISTMTKLAAGGGIAVTAVVIMMLLSVGDNGQLPESRLTAGSGLDGTPGGDAQANNQRYKEILEQANDQRSQRAAELGITFIPTPETVMQPIIEVQAPDEVVVEAPKEAAPAPTVVSRIAPPPPPPVVRRTEAPRPAPAQDVRPNPQGGGNGQNEGENPYISRILSDAAQNRGGLGMLAVAGLADEQGGSGTRVENPNGTVSHYPAGTQPPAPTAEAILLPGDILYAETLTSVDSDSNTPVIAQVTTGEFKGARLVGSFQTDRNSNRLVVSFETMTVPDGKTYDVAGFAVDGKTAESAVRSSVDHRLMKRYAPIFAANFVSAFAQTLSRPATERIVDGGETFVTQGQGTAEEARMAGYGAAASAIAGDIGSMAPKGAKISLRSGFPIAIMITEQVGIPQELGAVEPPRYGQPMPVTPTVTPNARQPNSPPVDPGVTVRDPRDVLRDRSPANTGRN